MFPLLLLPPPPFFPCTIKKRVSGLLARVRARETKHAGDTLLCQQEVIVSPAPPSGSREGDTRISHQGFEHQRVMLGNA